MTSVIIWARNYWLADVKKNGSVHYGLQGTQSLCAVLHIMWFFLQVDKIGAGCTNLIMLRITGMHTAVCGLWGTWWNFDKPACSIISLKTSMYVCCCSWQKASACQFLSCEENKMKKMGCLHDLIFYLILLFQTFKLFLSIKWTTSKNIPLPSLLGADLIGHELHTKMVTTFSSPTQNCYSYSCWQGSTQAQYNRRRKKDE